MAYVRKKQHHLLQTTHGILKRFTYIILHVEWYTLHSIILFFDFDWFVPLLQLKSRATRYLRKLYYLVFKESNLGFNWNILGDFETLMCSSFDVYQSFKFRLANDLGYRSALLLIFDKPMSVIFFFGRTPLFFDVVAVFETMKHKSNQQVATVKTVNCNCRWWY